MSWTVWIEFLSPIRYIFEFFVRNEFEGRNLIPDPIQSLNFYLARYSVCLVLIAYMTLYIIIAFLMLRFTTKALKN
jgi:hypothetical protein